MPIYEYQCQSCDRRFEVMQRMSEPALTTCDDCGGDLKKLISAPAFQFKGDGWYVTDYAKKDSKGGSGGSSSQGEGSGDSKGGDSKGDSKSGSDSGGSSDKSSSDSGGSGKTSKGGSESTS